MTNEETRECGLPASTRAFQQGHLANYFVAIPNILTNHLVCAGCAVFLGALLFCFCAFWCVCVCLTDCLTEFGTVI